VVDANMIDEDATVSVTSVDQLKNKVFLNNFVKEIKDFGWNIVNHDSRLMGLSFRVNPEYSNGHTGYFISYNSQTGKMEEFELESLNDFTAEDRVDHKPFAKAVKSKKAFWTDPFIDPDNHINVIAYYKPVYVKGKLLGVMALEIDFDQICNNANSVKIYNTGKVILVNKEGGLLSFGEESDAIPADLAKRMSSHKNYHGTFVKNHLEQVFYSEKLTDNIYMVLVVPTNQITAERDKSIFTIISITILLAAVLVFLCTNIIHRVLTLANTDSLTGVYNKLYYKEKVSELDQAIMEHKILSLAIAVLDLNRLKATNDEKGHEAGDMMIKEAASSIQGFFKGSDIYRIGGDEFVVIFDKCIPLAAQKKVQVYQKMMEKRAAEYRFKESAVVSCGFAAFEMTDRDFNELFNRADRSMYKEKAKFYALNPQIDRRK
jgi:diguanylate cyclase (GGDEF)-like protein